MLREVLTRRFDRRWLRAPAFVVVHAAFCAVATLAAGWLIMELDPHAKHNEFRGMYLVAALYAVPITCGLALPGHIYFLVRSRGRSQHTGSLLASACAGLAVLVFVSCLVG